MPQISHRFAMSRVSLSNLAGVRNFHLDCRISHYIGSCPGVQAFLHVPPEAPTFAKGRVGEWASGREALNRKSLHHEAHEAHEEYISALRASLRETSKTTTQRTQRSTECTERHPKRYARPCGRSGPATHDFGFRMSATVLRAGCGEGPPDREPQRGGVSTPRDPTLLDDSIPPFTLWPRNPGPLPQRKARSPCTTPNEPHL